MEIYVLVVLYFYHAIANPEDVDSHASHDPRKVIGVSSSRLTNGPGPPYIQPYLASTGQIDIYAWL